MTTKTVQTDTDIDAFYAWAQKQGWNDGLPVIPPTLERVQAMMSTVTLDPQQVIAQLPPRRGPCTVEKVAANAVMAGCLPEYFPIVLAAVEAAAGPGYDAYGKNTTTNPVAPVFIVNGPIRNEIGINCSWSCFGPGNRANATIGRAMSLVMVNIAGRIPGEVSKSTHAQPGRYTFCFGEYEENSPWDPLHVEKGFKKEESTVTVHGTENVVNVVDIDSQNGAEILRTMASCMMLIGTNAVFPSYGGHNILVVWCPSHARVIAETFTKRQAKEYLAELANKIPNSFQTERRLKRLVEEGRGQVQGDFFRLLETPDKIDFVVAGGHGGYHSVVMHGMSRELDIAPIRYRKQ